MIGEWSWSYWTASVPTDNRSLALYIVDSPNVNRLKYILNSIWASACQTATILLDIFLLFPNCTFGVTAYLQELISYYNASRVVFIALGLEISTMFFLGHVKQHYLALTYWSTSNKTWDNWSPLDRSEELQQVLFIWDTLEWDELKSITKVLFIMWPSHIFWLLIFYFNFQDWRT